MALPFMISPQETAVTGGAYRRRRIGDSERGLRSYLQSQVPAMRAAKERRKRFEQWEAEQEQLAGQHAETMDLRKQEIAERAAVAKEQAERTREGLEISRRAQKETEKQAKYALGIQGVSTALQALPVIFGGQPVTTAPYPRAGWQSEQDEPGGREPTSEFPITFDTCTCLTFLYGSLSQQVRYARVFCGRFMNLATLLGYYQIAGKIIKVLKRYPVFIKPMKRCLAGPFYNFMLWKLGRRDKVSVLTKAWSRAFMWVCRKQEQRRKTVMVLPPNFERCVNMVREN